MVKAIVCERAVSALFLLVCAVNLVLEKNNSRDLQKCKVQTYRPYCSSDQISFRSRDDSSATDLSPVTSRRYPFDVRVIYFTVFWRSTSINVAMSLILFLTTFFPALSLARSKQTSELL